MLLLPKDPKDDSNCFLEIRLVPVVMNRDFSPVICFRMYSKYSERRGWRMEIMSTSDGEHGGYKEIIVRMEGESVYGVMKFDRAVIVQRVPETESQGRSAYLSLYGDGVAGDPGKEIPDINPADLRIDTFRASGRWSAHQ